MEDIISDDFNGISCEIINKSEVPQDETKSFSYGRGWQVVDTEGNPSADGDKISINNRSNVTVTLTE